MDDFNKTATNLIKRLYKLFMAACESYNEKMEVVNKLEAAGFALGPTEGVVCGYCGERCGVHRPEGAMSYWDVQLDLVRLRHAHRSVEIKRQHPL